MMPTVQKDHPRPQYTKWLYFLNAPLSDNAVNGHNIYYNNAAIYSFRTDEIFMQNKSMSHSENRNV
jgi:hypothetical protein